VDIHAASVNGADWKVRGGQHSQVESFSYLLGRDFSGVISAVGAGVDDLNPGTDDVSHKAFCNCKQDRRALQGMDSKIKWRPAFAATNHFAIVRNQKSWHAV
jgi:NADPH:quinone reductase-like Zn-dependent oxidoreductase